MKLARTVAQTVDVDGMLARMTPQQFDEWMHEHNERPWGDDWPQASVIACSIINEIRQQLNGNIKDSDLLALDTLVPKPTEEKPETDTLTQSLATMRALAGV